MRGDFKKRLQVGLSLGYQFMGYKDQSIGLKYEWHGVPILPEILFTPGSEQVRLILGTGVGAYYISEKTSVTQKNRFFPFSTFTTTETRNDIYFGFCPLFGLRFKLSSIALLDISGRRHFVRQGSNFAGITSIHAGLTFYFQSPDSE